MIIERDNKQIILSDRHSIYAQDVMDHFDYYYNLSDTPNFSAPRYYKIDGFDDPLFFTGFPESIQTAQQYIDLLQIKPGDIVIDAGAYCGLTSLMFERAGAKVIALEPDEENYKALCENAPHIQKSQLALWHSNTEEPFNHEGNLGSAIGIRGDNLKSVGCITLQELTKEMTRLDAIKIDIEGAEFVIMDTLKEPLQRLKPRIAIEVHRPEVEAITSKLKGFGYDVRIVQQVGTNFPLAVGECC